MSKRMLRKTALSTAMALFVATLVLGAWHFAMDRGDDNRAQAAVPGQSGEIVRAHELSIFEKHQLRRTISTRPDSFLVMKGRDVEAILKEPELVRADFPTVVWQYRSEDCVLDIYLASMERDASKAPVVHYEIRSRSGQGEETEEQSACLRQLL